ncbi:MAG: gamma carbonic anhydrase family protein [Deltaproteobacteria bacterium]|jgi:carbonic anhydrase/acetyltransferase-like protein (isoleucine patch superfamily)|nr:gamma carbonic anhydrase family protein [Deltaproteobacteria bacterium]
MIVQSIHESVFIADGAQLYGCIEIGEGSSVWPNVVMRAEAQSIRVGRYTNLQDFVMVHIGYGDPTVIGDFCSITHHTTIHGCRIEDYCLIGINAVIMDRAVIGAGSIVAGGAMVTEDSVFAPGSIIAGVPAQKISERDCARANRLNAWQYHHNAQGYLRHDHRVWDGPEYAKWLAEIETEIETDRDLERLGG